MNNVSDPGSSEPLSPYELSFYDTTIIGPDTPVGMMIRQPHGPTPTPNATFRDLALLEESGLRIVSSLERVYAPNHRSRYSREPLPDETRFMLPVHIQGLKEQWRTPRQNAVAA